MRSETEVQRLKDLNEIADRMLQDEDFRALAAGAPIENLSELFVGTMIAVVDALFAIRDEEEWRGEIEPQKIAKKILQAMYIGD